MYLFLMIPWVGLQSVIEAFSGHYHLPFALTESPRELLKSMYINRNFLGPVFIFRYHFRYVALPHKATDLSAVCDCGISLSYSLTIY